MGVEHLEQISFFKQKCDELLKRDLGSFDWAFDYFDEYLHQNKKACICRYSRYPYYVGNEVVLKTFSPYSETYKKYLDNMVNGDYSTQRSDICNYIEHLTNYLDSICVVYVLKDYSLQQFLHVWGKSISLIKRIIGNNQYISVYEDGKLVTNHLYSSYKNIVIIELDSSDAFIKKICNSIVELNQNDFITITYFCLYSRKEIEKIYDMISQCRISLSKLDNLWMEAIKLRQNFEFGYKLYTARKSYKGIYEYVDVLHNQEKIAKIDEYIRKNPSKYDEKEIEAILNSEGLNKLTILEILQSCVYFWDSSIPNCKFNYFYHYYPTTVSCRLEKIDYSVRNMIWSFKNDKSGEFAQEQYQKALDYLLPKITKYLKITFGDYLDKLTLVCIPASSKVKNQARFNIFSERLCELTGMNNGYPHIVVKKDRPQRKSGGKKIDLETIDFNRDFFKDKYILLFDDLITTGSSMIEMKNKLEEFGSKVICGFSIGKTEHNKI